MQEAELTNILNSSARLVNNYQGRKVFSRGSVRVYDAETSASDAVFCQECGRLIKPKTWLAKQSCTLPPHGNRDRSSLPGQGLLAASVAGTQATRFCYNTKE